MKTDIFSTAGGSNAIFDHLPHVQPKDIADGVMFALSAGPNVRVSVAIAIPLSSASDGNKKKKLLNSQILYVIFIWFLFLGGRGEDNPAAAQTVIYKNKQNDL